MNPVQFLSSTIGKKFLVALTGLFMVLFLIMHLVGNLEIFSGPHAVNQYSAFLHSMPKALWGFRIALLVSVGIHIYLTISLAKQNQLARKEKYALKRSRAASLSSRTMLISGITVFVFICYHLAHYTFGITDSSIMNLTDDQGRHHVYNMMVMGFSHPLVSGFYVLAQVLLAFHLSHGISSLARTLGFTRREIYQKFRVFGIIFAVAVALLYCSIPISVLLGIVPLDL